MQRYEAAAIHMQQNFNDISFLFSDFNRLENVRTIHPDLIFSYESIAFLSAISSELVKSSKVRQHSDVATFAFFCRKANLMSLKNKYTEVGIQLGRGVVFHIAPSNVPVNFAYSMVAGILSGNINIVRVPSKVYEQVDIICEAVSKVAKNPDFIDTANRLFLVRYDRQNEATAKFSLLCDVRIIWGGDETIAQIRKSILPARSYDVTFADRYSFAAINADQFIHEQNTSKIADGFFNDTYLFDQNACSAPRLVIWTGINE
ncbi:MAG: acyl-CoA reductase, partial [Paludibacter sp.]